MRERQKTGDSLKDEVTRKCIKKQRKKCVRIKGMFKEIRKNLRSKKQQRVDF